MDLGLTTSPDTQARPTRSANCALLITTFILGGAWCCLQRFGFRSLCCGDLQPWYRLTWGKDRYYNQPRLPCPIPLWAWQLTSFIWRWVHHMIAWHLASVTPLIADALLAASGFQPCKSLNPNGRSWCGRLDSNQQVGRAILQGFRSPAFNHSATSTYFI